MNTRSHFYGQKIAFASIVLAAAVLAACESKQASAPDASAPSGSARAAAASPSATSEKVFVIFDGPWAFAPDPKDPNMLLAIAPKTKSHRDLQVSASNKATLAAGTYDLSVPAHGTATAGTSDPTFAQAQIDAKSLDHALGAKSERYVIRVPKPEGYAAAMRYRSRIGASYPPDASTEKDYVTAASLRYSVGSLSGFSLAGTPDSGTFNPLLLQADTPTITFLIDPAIGDLPLDNCSTHSRTAFAELTKLLKITLYVDFPESSSGCHDKDPQKPRAKAEAEVSPMEQLAALLGRNLTDLPVPSGGVADSTLGVEFLAWGFHGLTERGTNGFYFFGTHPTNCRAPVLILSVKP